MDSRIKKPYLIFWGSLPILLLVGVLSGDTVLDINIHDTYFVISHAHLNMLLSTYFGIAGLVYWVMGKSNRKLSKWPVLFHIILTFGGILLVFILSQLFRDSILEFEFNSNLTLAINLIIVVIVIGQIIFPANVVYGLIKKHDNVNSK